MRRLLDLLIGSCALVLLSPLMAVIAVLVKNDSEGPVIFAQERMGRGGRTFRMFKFRTMSIGSSGGSLVTSSGDMRVTRVGRPLRSSKLDELPQLFNVLRGDMSLIGPRPEVPKYAALWKDDQRKWILSVRPGVTDPVTIQLRREEELLARQSNPEEFYANVLLPEKAASYVQYLGNRRLPSDLLVLVRTFRSVLRG